MWDNTWKAHTFTDSKETSTQPGYPPCEPKNPESKQRKTCWVIHTYRQIVTNALITKTWNQDNWEDFPMRWQDLCLSLQERYMDIYYTFSCQAFYYSKQNLTKSVIKFTRLAKRNWTDSLRKVWRDLPEIKPPKRKDLVCPFPLALPWTELCSKYIINNTKPNMNTLRHRHVKT